MITEDLLIGIIIGISFCHLVKVVSDLIIKIMMIKNKK